MSVIAISVACATGVAVGEEKKAAEPKISADQAKAAFAAKFTEYKAAIAEIEKLQAEFQTADAAKREKLNATMAAQVTHAQSLVNAMVEAGEAAYRAAPNTDPEVTNLLFTVAKYYTIGRQIGPGAPSPTQSGRRLLSDRRWWSVRARTSDYQAADRRRCAGKGALRLWLSSVRS